MAVGAILHSAVIGRCRNYSCKVIVICIMVSDDDEKRDDEGGTDRRSGCLFTGGIDKM